MFFKAYRPSLALEPYIRSYYYLDAGKQSAGTEFVARYPTDGSPKLIVNLGDTFLAGSDTDRLKSFSGCRLLGPLTQQLITKASGRSAFIAIRFMPGKIKDFFGVMGRELTDFSASLESLWGVEGKVFEDRICEFGSIEEMLNFVEATLLMRLKQRTLVDDTVDLALETIWNARGQVRINDLADFVRLSVRQLERRFTKTVGLNPKRLCRINRFADFLSGIETPLKRSWINTAIEGGYSDHAHFIRECNFFTGLSPQSYLDLRSPLEVAVWGKNNAPRVNQSLRQASSLIKNPLV